MTGVGWIQTHGGQPVLAAGAPLEEARAAVLLVHGRGATAESILTLSHELGRDDVAYLAPQAAGNSWYPLSFLAPIEQNEPGLSSGLASLEAVVEGAELAGLPSERQLLIGFSQGACLTLEFAARNARRYGGVVGLTRHLRRLATKAGEKSRLDPGNRSAPTPWPARSTLRSASFVSKRASASAGR